MNPFTANLTARLSKIKHIPLLDKLSPSSTHTATPAELEGFIHAQGMAYAAAIHAAQNTREGMTEKEVAGLMSDYLYERDVRAYFHRSLAWFGERSRFKGMRSGHDAVPSDRVLQKGEVVTLDVAPVVGSYVGDIGLTFALEKRKDLSEARTFLLHLRGEIARLFSEPSMTAREIWHEIDRQVKEKGYENCYRKYQFSILGHRAHKIPLGFLPSPMVVFSSHSYWALLTRGFFPELLTPTHEGSKEGVWSIEPHFGVNKEYGIKFEEILVVQDGKARWLSDDVPHLKLPKGVY